MSGKLYLVGTPIGNLGDFSERAIEVLKSVDFIAAEDTRVTIKLLNRFDIKKPLISYFEHNRIHSGDKIVDRILSGESVALVSDAGMPAISDPGEDLVKLCAASGVEVCVIPGPCAAVCALALSGLPTQRFTFEGFLSTANKPRQEHLDSLENEKRTMIIYEAPHKLCQTLSDLRDTFGGERKLALCREITKIHEEALRMTLNEAIAFYETTPPKGEYVLVVQGKTEEAVPQMSIETAMEKVCAYRDQGKSLKQATKLVSEETGFSKNELYNKAIEQ